MWRVTWLFTVIFIHFMFFLITNLFVYLYSRLFLFSCVPINYCQRYLWPMILACYSDVHNLWPGKKTSMFWYSPTQIKPMVQLIHWSQVEARTSIENSDRECSWKVNAEIFAGIWNAIVDVFVLFSFLLL